MEKPQQNRDVGRRARPYIAPALRRKRGGQPGNVNAFKHGGTTQRARAQLRQVRLLIAECRLAVAHCRLVFPQRHVHTVLVIREKEGEGGGVANPKNE
jgi:hypothetical protein